MIVILFFIVVIITGAICLIVGYEEGKENGKEETKRAYFERERDLRCEDDYLGIKKEVFRRLSRFYAELEAEELQADNDSEQERNEADNERD